MLKRMLIFGLAVIVCAMPLCGAAQAQFDFSGAVSAAVFEAQGLTLIDGTDPDVRYDAAGLSKLPALLIILECMDSGVMNSTDSLTVSEPAARATGPTAFLEAGESMSVDGLMRAAVMITASDAIVTLAEHCMGESEFIQRMNKRLTELGVEVALSDITGTGAMFSCRELAAVSAAILNTKSFPNYSNLYYEQLLHEDGRITELASSNKLIRSFTGCSGVATGSSAAAGYCGVFSARRGESAFIAVVLGAKSSADRSQAASSSLELAFTAYRTVIGIKKGEAAANVLVDGGISSQVELVAKEDITMLLLQGETADKKITAPDRIQAPVEAGSELGRVEFIASDGKVIGETALVPSAAVPSAGYFDRVREIFLVWLHV